MREKREVKFKKKRGELSLYLMFELVFAFIVFLFLLKGVQTWAEQEIVLRESLSKDLSLLLDTLYSLPYNAYLIYPYDASKFTISVSENKVKVVSNKNLFYSSYPYIGFNEFTINKELKNPSLVYLYKINNKIGISKDREEIAFYIDSNCPLLNTHSSLKEKQIILNPDPSLVSLALSIADYFSFYDLILLTREKEEESPLSINSLETEKTDVIIDLKTYEGKEIIIKTPQSSARKNEEEKFSCLLQYNINLALNQHTSLKKTLQTKTKYLYLVVFIPSNLAKQEKSIKELKKAFAKTIKEYYS